MLDLTNITKCLIKNDYILCAILAIAFAAAPYFMGSGACPISLAYCLSAVFTFLALLLFAGFTRTMMNRAATDLNADGTPGFVERAMSTRHHVLRIALFIILIWLPVLVLLYPGTLINDTWGELNQYIVFSDYAQDTPSGFKIPVHKTKTFYFITHILQKQKLITLVRRQ